jgi:hypothetical protein
MPFPVLIFAVFGNGFLLLLSQLIEQVCHVLPNILGKPLAEIVSVKSNHSLSIPEERRTISPFHPSPEVNRWPRKLSFIAPPMNPNLIRPTRLADVEMLSLFAARVDVRANVKAVNDSSAVALAAEKWCIHAITHLPDVIFR